MSKAEDEHSQSLHEMGLNLIEHRKDTRARILVIATLVLVADCSTTPSFDCKATAVRVGLRPRTRWSLSSERSRSA